MQAFVENVSVERISRPGFTSVAHSFENPSANNCMTTYIEKLPRYWDYFKTISMKHPKSSRFEGLDGDSLTAAYHAYMQNDSTLKSILADFEEKVIKGSIPKDTISFNTFLGIAVKYFNILKINEEGHYVTKLCIGQNALSETESIRHHEVEAFAFAILFGDFMKPEYGIVDEFHNAVKKLYKINLGADGEAHRLRAQGAVFMQMYDNPVLRQMFIDAFEKYGDIMPFVVEMQ